MNKFFITFTQKILEKMMEGQLNLLFFADIFKQSYLSF